MRRQIVYIIVLLSCGNSLWGQLQPLMDQYHLNGLTINPAYAGSQDALSANIYTRQQWVGFEGAPQNFTFSIHSPLRNRKVNLGLILLDDRLGSLKETGFLFNYAYRIELGKGSFSMGLGGGFSSLSSDLSAMVFSDQGDALIEISGKRALIPEFSFGSYYYTKKFYLGLSTPLISSPRIEDAKFKMNISPGNMNYLFTGGYLFRISENVEALSSMLLKTNPGNNSQLDIHTSFIYKEKFWLGVGIRGKTSMTGLLKIQINPQLLMAYTYGYELSELSSYQHGTHEFTLQYSLSYILDVFSPRYF